MQYLKLATRLKNTKAKEIDHSYYKNESFEILLHKINRYFIEYPAVATAYLQELYYLNHKLDSAVEEKRFLYAVFHYEFTKKYFLESIEIERDTVAEMSYVVLGGKRLYYARVDSSEEIAKNFMYLLIEQDIESPHRYLDEIFY